MSRMFWCQGPALCIPTIPSTHFLSNCTRWMTVELETLSLSIVQAAITLPQQRN